MYRHTCNDSEMAYQLRQAKSELNRFRSEQEEQQEREARDRKDRIQERIREMDERYRQARTWPEALGKQANLMGREIYLEREDDPGETHYFSGGHNACQRALELWTQEEAKRAATIAELERRLAELRTDIRETVGSQLATENNNSGWQFIAHALLAYDEDEDELTDWLNW